MPTWKPGRDPNKYPATWHAIIKDKPGQRLLALVTTKEEVRRTANKFNAFKASLREHPLHETTRALNARHVRLSVEPAGKEFAVWVKTRWAQEVLGLLTGQLSEDDVMEEVFRKKGEQPE